MSEFQSAEGESKSGETASFTPKGPARRRADLSTRIFAEQVRLLFDMGATSRYTLFGAILIVGLAFYRSAPIWATAVPMVIQAIAQLSFDRVRAGFRADPEATFNARLWARRYALITLISGSTWGIGSLLWLPGSSFAYEIFYALLVALLSMATAISRASYPPAVAAYVGATVTPTLILLLLSGDPLGLATVTLACIFLLVLVGWTRQVNRSFTEAIRLRFENADLVERMARAHSATEQKRADAEEAERRAIAASSAKSEFLALLGHEVRTPLDSISRMASQLRDEPLSEMQLNLAQAMAESSRMLSRLFDDMIDFSQMEARALELKPLSFDPATLARSVVRLMRPHAKERGLSLELDLTPGTPAYMTTDPDRLRQVLVNLLSNAIKFTETGGVVLRLQPVSNGGSVAGLRFSVLDTGAGLTPEIKARLFESFAQGGSVGQDRPMGMGLGLAIADRLVKLMGGRIGVDSAAGQGSTFWFLLPIRPGMSLPATNAAENGALPAYPRELLIDHDYLYELERELGHEKITDRMVAALDRILDLQREMEAARSCRNADALAAHFAAIQKEAGESGLPAIAGLAQEMAQAIGRGLHENGLPDVQRLQHKIAATRHALALAFPRLGS
ncbi:HAMP domain-containing sensor histidine kinase [Parvibaculum sp.]|uniref:sensor histidine kinase n=1 Tax=Parvibaculum sp. TaxID=2024848 RepID=UPI00320CBA52